MVHHLFCSTDPYPLEMTLSANIVHMPLTQPWVAVARRRVDAELVIYKSEPIPPRGSWMRRSWSPTDWPSKTLFLVCIHVLFWESCFSPDRDLQMTSLCYLCLLFQKNSDEEGFLEQYDLRCPLNPEASPQVRASVLLMPRWGRYLSSGLISRGAKAKFFSLPAFNVAKFSCFIRITDQRVKPRERLGSLLPGKCLFHLKI